MNKLKEIKNKYGKKRYWLITKQEIGREVYNPDYTRDLENLIESLTAERDRLKAEVESLKCCGNCFHYDVLRDYGGVCTIGGGQMSCDHDGKCGDWMTIKIQEAEK